MQQNKKMKRWFWSLKRTFLYPSSKYYSYAKFSFRKSYL